MHPILAEHARLLPYAGAWVVLGGAFAVVLAGRLPWMEAIALALPVTLPYGSVCLSSWYVCRAVPLAPSGQGRLLATHLGAAFLASSLGVALTRLWAFALASVHLSEGAPAAVSEIRLPLVLVGLLLYLLSSALHYVVLAFEEQQEALRRALELKVASTEAELRALRAQIDPHFLFNSLNSISALVTVDPKGAREMCLRLSALLRGSLTLGQRESIRLEDELALVSQYVEIEKVRFGSRLGYACVVEEAVKGAALPPLLLQPLVENAVVHGIAHRLEGGTVRVDARRHGERLQVVVTNPCDADRPRSRGAGIGLGNVRKRVEAAYGREGRVDASETADGYRVEVTVPLAVG